MMKKFNECSPFVYQFQNVSWRLCMISCFKGGLISKSLSPKEKILRGEIWHPFLEMSAKVKNFLKLNHLSKYRPIEKGSQNIWHQLPNFYLSTYRKVHLTFKRLKCLSRFIHLYRLGWSHTPPRMARISGLKS